MISGAVAEQPANVLVVVGCCDASERDAGPGTLGRRFGAPVSFPKSFEQRWIGYRIALLIPWLSLAGHRWADATGSSGHIGVDLSAAVSTARRRVGGGLAGTALSACGRGRVVRGRSAADFPTRSRGRLGAAAGGGSVGPRRRCGGECRSAQPQHRCSGPHPHGIPRTAHRQAPHAPLTGSFARRANFRRPRPQVLYELKVGLPTQSGSLCLRSQVDGKPPSVKPSSRSSPSVKTASRSRRPTPLFVARHHDHRHVHTGEDARGRRPQEDAARRGEPGRAHDQQVAVVPVELLQRRLQRHAVGDQ